MINETFNALEHCISNVITVNKKNALSISYKDKEVVTALDHKLEVLLIEIIRSEFPDHTICSEETNQIQTDSEYTWFIDPIDNTVGFIANETPVITSISLKKGDQFIQSLLYDWNENIAYRSSEIKSIKPIDSVHSRLRGISSCAYVAKKHMAIVNNFYQSCWANRIPMRISGCSAHDLLQVAQGKRAAHVSLAAHPWDIEGGLHMVEASGGTVERLFFDTELNCWAFIAAQSETILKEIKEMLKYEISLS